MKRLIPLLLALLVQGALQADPVQDIIDASPKLDAPGPGYSGRRDTFAPIQGVKAPVDPGWSAPSTPQAINPWSESHKLDSSEVTPAAKPPIDNPAIDYQTFAKNVETVGALREKRRLTEEEFLRMAAEPDTIVLDARSSDKYKGLHIKGAVNLPLPDMNVDDLARVIPSKTTRVLIYCNNNFEDLSAPYSVASVVGETAPKAASATAPASTPVAVASSTDEQKSAHGRELIGVPPNPQPTPYANKGFVVFRKSGDGAILMKRKSGAASLNIYTYNTLYSYGYENVYELGPLIEIQNTILPFEGTSLTPKK